MQFLTLLLVQYLRVSHFDIILGQGGQVPCPTPRYRMWDKEPVPPVPLMSSYTYGQL